MSRLSKRQKWVLNGQMERVLEPQLPVPGDECFENRGHWATRCFAKDRPITLELGCGKGTFSVELARSFPERNFVGVDIKGHRFYTGAQQAEDLGLDNLVFLRAQIQQIERYFGPGEVSEIWLTFSDPQPKDGKGTKRITSGRFVERYRKLCQPGGIVHIKTDSPLVYGLALEELGPNFLYQTKDVHGPWLQTVPEPLRSLLAFQTPYEKRWIAEGRKIAYLSLAL
ncbi:MAG TPA: tRNA (guanosine(46)-N7)-methyltransferase TrmB [Planctomycetota bacterium]|nr:tRNA (guanosine(46)-N7)-methyltransferase TrmB [Planctomycetota bacterium]